ncbi:ferrous iron transporter B, partial [Oleiphilus sp. HI0043]|uniref:ferrous iron transporter B n=2 Tax=Oleiphilus TaxID=141450 RepID=UPI000B1D041D
KVTRDYLLSADADLIVNVVDASNLERNLYFTVQLREMGVPVVVALNMMDVARKRGISLDVERLSEALCCPVVPIVAVTGEGLKGLASAIKYELSSSEQNSIELVHEDLVEQAILSVSGYLPATVKANEQRWVATKLLENDSAVLGAIESAGQKELLSRVSHWQSKIEERTGEDVDIHIADGRFNHAHCLSQEVIKEAGVVGKNLSDKIDHIVLGKRLGIGIFLLVMYAMFTFTINVGGAF